MEDSNKYCNLDVALGSLRSADLVDREHVVIEGERRRQQPRARRVEARQVLLGPEAILLAVAARWLLESGQHRPSLPAPAVTLAWGLEPGAPLYVGDARGRVFAIREASVEALGIPATRVPRGSVVELQPRRGLTPAVVHLNAFDLKLRLHSLASGQAGLSVVGEGYVATVIERSGYIQLPSSDDAWLQ